ncbi:TatD family deoxyribonuclease, partial [Campylobacter sp. CH185]
LAIEFKKPVIIHSREANHDTYEILHGYSKDLVGGVLHCFNASEHLLTLFEEGFYFGIGGVLTFKNAKKLVEILPKIPKDKLLLETDAPYLTPEPYRGKRNEPLLTQFVANKMCEVLNLSRKELLEICFNNSEKLFFKGY